MRFGKVQRPGRRVATEREPARITLRPGGAVKLRLGGVSSPFERIKFLDDLSPEFVSERMIKLGLQVEALAIVTAEHPRITHSIEVLHEAGVPTFALISQLSAPCGVGYVGPDSWKVGRTSAWFFGLACKMPGKIGILVGNHRYRSQELNEAGFPVILPRARARVQAVGAPKYLRIERGGAK